MHVCMFSKHVYVFIYVQYKYTCNRFAKIIQVHTQKSLRFFTAKIYTLALLTKQESPQRYINSRKIF